MAYGCVSGKEYRKIKQDLMYGLEVIGISKGIVEKILLHISNPEQNGMLFNKGKRFGAMITNCIAEDFYERDLPIVEKYHNLCVINCCNEITSEDKENIRLTIEEMQDIFMEEYCCALGYEGFVTEDEKLFDNIHSALEHAKNQKWIDKHYIIEKVCLYKEETTHRFWYDEKLRMVGYEIIKEDMG